MERGLQGSYFSLPRKLEKGREKEVVVIVIIITPANQIIDERKSGIWRHENKNLRRERSEASES